MEQFSDEAKAEIVQSVFLEYADDPTPLNFLWPFVESVKTTDPDRDENIIRRLEIELSESSSIAIVRAKTTKLSNLRFKMKDALTKEVPELALETLSVAHDTFGSVTLALLLLRLLRAAFDLSTIPLSSIDGRVLVELFKFAKEEHVIKFDAFFSYMHGKIDTKELYRSLNKLERLSCIERSDTDINLIEEILIK